MPIRWDHEKDRALLLLMLDQVKSSVNYDEIIRRWRKYFYYDLILFSNSYIAFPETPSKKAITEHVAKLKRDTAGSGNGTPVASNPRTTNSIPRKRAAPAQKGSAGKKSKGAQDSDDDTEVHINSHELKDITNSAVRFTKGAKQGNPLNLSINTAYANKQAAAKSSAPTTPRSARKASHAATAAIKTYVISDSSDDEKDSDVENNEGQGATNVIGNSMNAEQRRRLDELRKEIDTGDNDNASVYESAAEDIKGEDPMEV
jgi:hypothetical protein